VRLYSDFGELADSVARYLAAGFERGDTGVIVARPENTAAILARLGPTDDALLTAAPKKHSRSSWSRVNPSRIASRRSSAHCSTRRKDAGRRDVCVFGEMVDILWGRGRHAVDDPGAARVYLAAAESANGKVPLAQAVLAWLTANEPTLAQRVLPVSRRSYLRDTTAVG
jgi:hypothetical protein